MSDLDDPKYRTDFAHTVWNVRPGELDTTDFLSDRAARSLVNATAKYVIDNLNPEIDAETIPTYAWVASHAASLHPIGDLLGDKWQRAFGREFIGQVRDGMLYRIEQQKRFAAERIEREARVAAYEAERAEAEKVRARKVLGMDND